MKKLFFVAMTFIALSFAACGDKITGNVGDNDSVIIDSTTQVDSITTDSIAK